MTETTDTTWQDHCDDCGEDFWVPREAARPEHVQCSACAARAAVGTPRPVLHLETVATPFGGSVTVLVETERAAKEVA